MIAVAIRLAPLNRRKGEGVNRRHGVTASGVLNGIMVVPGAVSIPQKGAHERIDPFGCIKLPAASRPTAISCSAWNSGVNNRAGIVAALLVEK